MSRSRQKARQRRKEIRLVHQEEVERRHSAARSHAAQPKRAKSVLPVGPGSLLAGMLGGVKA